MEFEKLKEEYKKLYPDIKQLYGPYDRKSDKRKMVTIHFYDGKHHPNNMRKH